VKLCRLIPLRVAHYNSSAMPAAVRSVMSVEVNFRPTWHHPRLAQVLQVPAPSLTQLSARPRIPILLADRLGIRAANPGVYSSVCVILATIMHALVTTIANRAFLTSKAASRPSIPDHLC